jgi:hypothetical protein
MDEREPVADWVASDRTGRLGGEQAPRRVRGRDLHREAVLVAWFDVG